VPSSIWSSTPIARARAFGSSVSSAAPSSSIRPAAGFESPASAWMSVLLPVPLRPSTAHT
jgi:hypothetical protein